MVAPLFDLLALFRDVDDERQRRGLSWAALTRQVGVATSTMRRFNVADDAEADGVLTLVGWLGVAPEHYVKGGLVEGDPLPNPGAGHIRVDMSLVASAEGDPKGADGRSRTTIQRLVQVAQNSRKTVSSLTRISDV